MQRPAPLGKPYTLVMNRLDETPESLVRSLTAFGIALLMLNGMIGAGIFVAGSYGQDNLKPFLKLS